jgi:signal transduction histidine kinase/DNA-binding response OmpR family regulator
MVLSILPAALVGAVSYHSAHERLEQEIHSRIRTTAALISARIKTDGLAPPADTGGQAGQPAGTALQDALQPLRSSSGASGSGWRIYLIDPDRTLIAGFTGGLQRIGDVIPNTAQTQRWSVNRTDGISDGLPPRPFTYRGADDRTVVGTHAPIILNGNPHALIVEMDQAAAFGTFHQLRLMIVTIVILTGSAGLAATAALVRALVRPLRRMRQEIARAAKTGFGQHGPTAADNEISGLAQAIDGLIDRLDDIQARHEHQSRFTTGLTDLHRLIGGEQTLETLCLNTLEFLSGRLELSQADVFIVDEDGRWTNAGHYPGVDATAGAVTADETLNQVASEMTGAFFRTDELSGLVTAVPKPDLANLLVVPLVLRKTVQGALRLQKANVFDPHEYHFAQAAAEAIAVALNAALTRRQELSLLHRTREQAKKLQLREAALDKNTKALHAQSRAYQQSEEKLQLKQLELEAANAQMVKNAADLEAHMAILQKQKRDMQKQNAELAQTHRELAEKARQLEASSRYKTEFMANMSHELRTPLNSILLLSRLLLENKDQTLTARQAEFARTVHSAGEDLLNLINEILDLAKVESGKMEIDMAPVRIHAITNAMLESFSPLAEQRALAFGIHVDPDVPETLVTDRKRIEQIVKNFLSNAFKFTEAGTVRLEVATARAADMNGVGSDEDCLTISVVDTGIGIPETKQKMVFEAFQQVDGSTRRKYGGTGLGLSISRELAHLLGGRIELESQAGEGSRFTLYLPTVPLEAKQPALRRGRERTASEVEPQPTTKGADPATDGDPVPDDRNRLTPGEKSVLIIDANPATTQPIKAYGHKHGYKVLVAEQFPTGLHFADYYQPSAIFINLKLPDGKGWEMVPRIKTNPKSRHRPVFTISAHKQARDAVAHGAAGEITTPISADDLESTYQAIQALQRRTNRQVLVVAPDPTTCKTITGVVSGPGIRTITASTAAEVRAVLADGHLDGVVLHPCITPEDTRWILGDLRQDPLPLLQYPAPPVPKTFQSDHPPDADAMMPYRCQTTEHLLLALCACLHITPEAFDDNQRHRLQAMDHDRNFLKGRTVLLVDDDMRTVFAVSNALEDLETVVLTGKTGKESLDKLDTFPEIDLILMDVMIADVDGYQAIRDIRRRNRYRQLPIIALTARAMQGDRAKCIRAGADDYLAKPVNLDKLTSMLKIWLEPRQPILKFPGGPVA